MLQLTRGDTEKLFHKVPIYKMINYDISEALSAFTGNVQTEPVVPIDDSGQTRDESFAIAIPVIHEDQAHDEQPSHKETTKVDEVEIVEKRTAKPDNNRQTEKENDQFIDEELSKKDEPNDKKIPHEETPIVHKVENVDDTHLLCNELLSPNFEDNEVESGEDLDETKSIENDSPKKCNTYDKSHCQNPLHNICRICSGSFFNYKHSRKGWINKKANIGNIKREIRKYKGTNILMDPSWYPIFAHKNSCYENVQKGLCIRETLPGFRHPGNVLCKNQYHVIKKPIRPSYIRRYDLLNIKNLSGKNRNIEKYRNGFFKDF